MNSDTSSSISSIVYSPTNSSYTSILEFSIQNFRFISSTTPKPQFIITPTQESHIQAAVICSKKHNYLIRVRSGGHDYEGLSYISYRPFIIIDLFNFQEINVDIKDNTAWVRLVLPTHGFAAGVCPPMGVGGHIGGGGIGFLMRKYGLAADNIVDACFIDVNGKLLNRKSMGEDLFWAIRGGGGASFGVIVAWKIQLVPVPAIVTVFNVQRTLEQGATNLFYKWQNSAHKFHENLLIRTIIQAVNGENGRTIQVVFQSVFQGTVKELLPLMQKSFPELGLEAKDCTEMSWINSTLNVAGLSGQPLEVLLRRSQQSKNYFKNKSDFVKNAITPTELKSLWKFMLEEADNSSPVLINEPLGGKMAKISESAIPFPHRAGNLYNIQYVVTWLDGSATARSLETSRRLYEYMTPYVSKSPRAAYVNYKDLDLGMNKDMNTSFKEASVWGEKYFKANFVRLSYVKKKVDPENFFWNEQSIPT
ncbi:hypothetical protein AQUCO_06600049v1 [Aquilegia coerulea]|uniref:FAD-binding PCMH-type domain-containing protein n=1 Tax=Aquilegia coerulea TaxID=218851 RepID=A0A2G5CC33_AQUCA|nr:hypothetical protein AQUCO_06600049v1 [Aquilegia coerulea]